MRWGWVTVVLLLAFLVAAHGYLDMLAPFSGSIWRSTNVKHVDNPYGKATVYYDSYGVPHIVADDEKALAFAIGYVQAKDRLFQMDLVRRLMRGQLSEVFGEEFYESDVFHVKMDFVSAAEASWKVLEKAELGDVLKAYSDGVNYCIKTCELPMEFKLAGYKPAEWTPVDTLLVGKLIAWGLTGNFWDLKRAVIAEKLGDDALKLYPTQMNHSYPIIRGVVDEKFVGWLENFEARPSIGSNNWVVAANLTKSGKPMLANDPHLSLTAPPVWYEMHVRLKGWNVRGVTFPGIPVIVIGWNDRLAWGFTNVGADVVDFYYYVWNGSRYLYKGKWLEVERDVKTIRVKTGDGVEERSVVVEKTVHGPLIERFGKKVAVSWTGLTATREALALYKYNYARNISEFIEAMKYFDVPAQNVVYADVDGNIMYYPAGKYPIRYVNGKEVEGNVIFNGSNGDGEWRGFKPYGVSTWEGFIPFEDIPHLINPPYVATANQRVVFNYEHYLGDSMYFADPYRGMRIYEILDNISKGKIGVEDFVAMQRDTYSKPAEFFIPFILEAYGKLDNELKDYADMLRNWDRRMNADSKEALIFALWLKHFVNETFGDEFFSVGLDESYYPHLYVLQNLPADSRWFDDVRTAERENRADIAARALKLAVEELKTRGYKVYGDYNVLRIEHPFSKVAKFFDYPEIPMSGSKYTVFNFRVDDEPQIGSSWRMIVTFDKNLCVIPGGNSGNYFSRHYHDQLELWARGEYKECGFELGGERIEFG